MESTSPPASRSPNSVTAKPGHKLLNKFAPFRKRQLRYARSEDALSDTIPDASDSAPKVVQPLPDSSIGNQGQWSFWPVPASSQPTQPAMSHSALPVPKSLPSYTPMPVPQRVSSHNREAVAYEQQPGQQVRPSQVTIKPRNSNIGQDDYSIRTDPAFDDELLRAPQTPVSPLLPPKSLAPPTKLGESPVLGRASTGSHKPIRQVEERPRGRSRPPTPAESAGTKSSLRDSESLAPPRVLSPPASVTSTNTYYLHAPTKLGPEALAQLQVPSPDKSDVHDTQLIYEDDPDSWDVINPNTKSAEEWDRSFYSLERRAEQLYSEEHLKIILEDKEFHHKFWAFLSKYRPDRLAILEYYWDAVKAMRAWEYANALTVQLSKKTPTANRAPPPVANLELQESAEEAFKQLLGDDLHWYIAHTYINIVRAVMHSRITGNLPAPLREASNGLAEVFCITDPTRRDNPIILASQAFTRHSGCGLDYILGRNCRFMQGPGTTVDSCRRFAISMAEQRDHSEIFVNYRRDGSPFLSMVMNAHLVDSSGNLRYFLGAQVDVSGLLKNCSGLESLTRLVEQQERRQPSTAGQQEQENKPATAIKSLSEMLTGEELDIIGNNGGVLKGTKGQSGHELQTSSSRSVSGPARVLLADGSSDDSDQGEPEVPERRPAPSERNVQQQQQQQQSPPVEDILTELNLRGVYKHYLIVRPAPSLRILFASPTLRVPGVLQSQFLHRIGGSRMRNDLNTAFQEAKVITARVRWLRSDSQDGEGEGPVRWIHCTPLMHHTGSVGLWMIVIVKPSDDDTLSKAVGRGGGSRLASRASDIDSRSGRSKNRPAQR